MPTSEHRKPRSPKPAHLPANTTDNATKTLAAAPMQPPNALPELAEMRGNEREIDLSALNRIGVRAIRLDIEEPPNLQW